MRSTGRLAVIAVAAILLTAGIAGLFIWSSNRNAAEVVPASVPFTSDTASSLSEALTSGDSIRVGEVVTLPPGTSVPQAFLVQMSDLSSLEFDTDSFIERRDGTAEVAALSIATDGTATRWTSHLVLADGRWKLAATVRTP